MLTRIPVRNIILIFPGIDEDLKGTPFVWESPVIYSRQILFLTQGVNWKHEIGRLIDLLTTGFDG